MSSTKRARTSQKNSAFVSRETKSKFYPIINQKMFHVEHKVMLTCFFVLFVSRETFLVYFNSNPLFHRFVKTFFALFVVFPLFQHFSLIFFNLVSVFNRVFSVSDSLLEPLLQKKYQKNKSLVVKLHRVLNSKLIQVIFSSFYQSYTSILCFIRPGAYTSYFHNCFFCSFSNQRTFQHSCVYFYIIY